ncbi:hypothetical protein KM043_010409 [Ampulex compressa]|nr:hypothetical protein KM043_010409 [Ampulex compressa]
MRIFKTVLLFVGIGSNVLCLPLTPESTTTSVEETSAPTMPGPKGDHYDQRQNGTENYNIHVDGVILVVAPVEALLLAGAGDSSFAGLSQNGLDASKPGSDFSKPKPEVDGPSRPPAAPKSGHRPNLRLMNILAPLLRRLRQE